MKNIEPIFVIIDDFSAFGENYGANYAGGSVNFPGAHSSVNVCLYDYGFVDFQETGS